MINLWEWPRAPGRCSQCVSREKHLKVLRFNSVHHWFVTGPVPFLNACCGPGLVLWVWFIVAGMVRLGRAEAMLTNVTSRTKTRLPLGCLNLFFFFLRQDLSQLYSRKFPEFWFLLISFLLGVEPGSPPAEVMESDFFHFPDLIT